MKRGAGIVIIAIAGVIMWQLSEQQSERELLTVEEMSDVASGAGEVAVGDLIDHSDGVLCLVRPYAVTLRGDPTMTAAADEMLDLSSGFPEGQIALYWSDGSRARAQVYTRSAVDYAAEMVGNDTDCVQVATGGLSVAEQGDLLVIGLFAQ